VSATPSYYQREILVSFGCNVVSVTLDPYAVARLWELNDPALFHAFKKILCAGNRGAKSKTQDIQEAKDALTRWMQLEDAARGGEIATKGAE
jgi:hypothetical protein